MNPADMPPMLRTPPVSMESEQVVVGMLMLDNALFDRISERLRPEHFYTHECRAVYTEIIRQIGSGKSCDPITVWQGLGQASGPVSLAGLSAMTLAAPAPSDALRHARIVIERARERALLAVSDEIGALVWDESRGIDQRIEAAQAQLARLLDEQPRDEWVSAHEAMVLHTGVLEERAEGRLQSWPTGIADLDEYLEGGLRPGSLVVVGARPGMGKTALAMTIGLHMAQSLSVGMLSMEMPHRELRDRMTAMLGRVSLSSVIRPSKGDGLAWDRVMDGATQAQALRWFVSDQGGLNIHRVRAKARNLKRLHGLNVLIVDYIGLMAGLDQKQPRAYQLEEISRGLKALAKELDIAVVCAAQVNRKVEERVNAVPALSDLRDSGAIEQDADVVLFVHRHIQARPDAGEQFTHYAKLSVAKNRQGRCGYMHLFYQGDQTRFDNWAGPAPSTHATAPARGFAVGKRNWIEPDDREVF
jgi:replicative DNA helicase